MLVLALVLCAGCADDVLRPEPSDALDEHLEVLGLTVADLEGADTDALRASIDFEAVAEVVRANESDAEPADRGRPVQVVRPGGSIQEAIDEAPAGGIVLIRRGTYEIEEPLRITKSLRLVGLGGPGAVVIAEKPGLSERPRNGIDVRSGTSVPVRDVSIVNLTVRGFTGNGVFLAGVDGFLLHRVTTDQLAGPGQDGGAYGLFPVRSVNGLITHCTATRADDSGIYVGQSENVAVVHNEAYGNVIGLEAENVRRTVWAHNRAYDNAAGMLAILLPEDGQYIEITYADQLYVAHNRFTDNNGVNFAPGGLAAAVPSGTGLIVFGYDDSEVTRNRVTGNRFVGIGLASAVTLLAAAGRFEDLALLATIPQGPHPDDVRITGNRVTGNGSGDPLEVGLPDGSLVEMPAADLIWDKPIIDLLGMDPSFPFGEYGEGNCWEDNVYGDSFPEELPACGPAS